MAVVALCERRFLRLEITAVTDRHYNQIPSLTVVLSIRLGDLVAFA